MTDKLTTCQFCMWRVRKRDGAKITHHCVMQPSEDYKTLGRVTLTSTCDKFKRRK